MPDREKVIKGLEICVTGECEYDCPYWNNSRTNDGCIISMMEDAIALLKEQEDGKPKGHWIPYEPDKRGYTDGFTCSRCERVVLSDHYCKMIDFDFCPYCGANMDNADGW